MVCGQDTTGQPPPHPSPSLEAAPVVQREAPGFDAPELQAQPGGHGQECPMAMGRWISKLCSCQSEWLERQTVGPSRPTEAETPWGAAPGQPVMNPPGNYNERCNGGFSDGPIHAATSSLSTGPHPHAALWLCSRSSFHQRVLLCSSQQARSRLPFVIPDPHRQHLTSLPFTAVSFHI